jgi:Type I restriction enzyme R protein N terminus (HSDR_N)
MAQVIAVTDAIKSLADAETRLNLQRNDQSTFFPEWQSPLPPLTPTEIADLAQLHRRLLYHRGDGELLEGAVVLLVVSPLLELAGFYDPPFKIKAETTIELTIDDGEEVLRGRIDVLVLQNRLWVAVLESKKTTISARSALPQALAYMMSRPESEQPLFGILTNGDDILFVKLTTQPTPQYQLSRAFSLYTLPSELQLALQTLKHLGQVAIGAAG